MNRETRELLREITNDVWQLGNDDIENRQMFAEEVEQKCYKLEKVIDEQIEQAEERGAREFKQVIDRVTQSKRDDRLNNK